MRGLIATGMAAMLWVAAGSVDAATIAAAAQTLGATSDLTARLPAAQTFTVTAGAQLKVVLGDLATPQAFTQLKLLLSRGGSKVASLDAAGIVQFAATPGDYKIQVVGVPAAASGATAAGTFDVQVTELTGNTVLKHFADGISAVSSAPATSIAFAQAGTYQVTLTDRGFPAALSNISLLLNPASASGAMGTLSGPCTNACTTSINVTAAGSYDLFVVATAAEPDQAGLYSLKIIGPGNAVAYATTQPVGKLAASTVVNVPTAGGYMLSSTDLATPAALSSLKLRVVQGADLLAASDVAGSSVTLSVATAGTVQLYAAARAGAGGVGLYGIGLTQEATPVYSDVRTLPAGFDTTLNAGGYHYAFAVPAAGNYRLQLRDLGFPAMLGQLRVMVIQNGALVQAFNATSIDSSIMLAAGTAFLAVVGTESAANANSLAGISLAPQTGATALLDRVQGFGALASARLVNIDTAGSYDLSISDLHFPAAFSELAIAVTRGSQLVGQVFGSGQLRFTAQVGSHAINVLARPDASAQYGTLGVELASTPPAPVITLAATPSAVPGNGTTTLTWSALGATSCTASGGWTGSRAISGTEVSAVIASAATFTLTCVGSGGSSSRSVDVTIKSLSDGGGALDVSALLLLAGLLYVRQRRLRA